MINNKKIAAIVQARCASTRLPGKVLMNLAGRSALGRIIERLRAAKLLDDVIVATTTNEKDNPIISLCESMGCSYYRGSEEDVLSRVLEAAREFKIDVIIEITGDCVLIDYNHIDYLVDLHMQNYGKYDLTTNIQERSFPRGFDIRIFDTKTLEKVNKEVTNPIDREHVSTAMYLNPTTKQNYKCLNWVAPPGQNRPDISVTLDTPEDLELLNWIFSFESQGYSLPEGLNCQTVINLIDTYPDKYAEVSKVKRKDYFEELKQAYAFINDLEQLVLMGSSPAEPIGILRGSGKENAKPKKQGRPCKPGRKKKK